MMRSTRFVTLAALSAVVAFGTGCPEPMTQMDAGNDARADANDARANEAGGDTASDSPVDSATDTGTDVVDAGADTGPMDSGMDVATDTGTDAGSDVAIDAPTDTGTDAPSDTSGIGAVRAAADGTLSSPIAVHDVTVTYVLPAVGTDPAGFFVQAAPTGPALFVAIDPTTLTPSPAVGDVVSFTVSEVTTVRSMQRVTMISSLAVSSSGSSIEPLRQDVSGETGLVSGVNLFESESIHLEGTIAAPFAAAGAMHSSAQIVTAGIPSATADLRLRVTDAVRNALDLAQGCSVVVDTPLWRFDTQVQVSAWSVSDITVNSCPAPRAVSALATSTTTVDVTFDRVIDPASLLANGSQFTIAGGLAVSVAAVSGRVVTLTTATQTVDAPYTITVNNTLTDTFGTPIDPAANTVMFTGFRARAIVRINEINATIGSSCDLIELRVVQGGAIGGYVLRERDTMDLITFPAMTVATNDLLVVHMNGASATCNPGGAMNETTSPSQFPLATNARNYDTAYDFYSTDGGLTNTDNVFTLFDASMNILDAVLVANDSTGTMTAAASETAAATVASANEWLQVGGGVPAGGYVDLVFRMNAVTDLDAMTMATAIGTSIQRIDNNDTNTRADWNDSSLSTWGALNPGQTAF